MAGSHEQFLQARTAVTGFRSMARDLLRTARVEQQQGNSTAIASARQLLRQELQAPEYQAHTRLYKQHQESLRRQTTPKEQILTEDIIHRYRAIHRNTPRDSRSGEIASLLTNTSNELVRSHFDEIGSVLELLKEKGEDEVYNRLSKRLISQVERGVASLSSHQLAKLTEWYAHSQHAAEPAKTLLKAYFHATELPIQQDPYQLTRKRLQEQRTKEEKRIQKELFAKLDTQVVVIPNREEENAIEKAKQRGQAEIDARKAKAEQELLQKLSAIELPALKVSKIEAQQRLALRKKRVELLKKYAIAIMEIAKYPQALKKAAQIVSGLDEEILSIRSGMYADYLISSNLEAGFLDPKEYNNAEQLPANPRLLTTRQENIAVRSDGHQLSRIFRGIQQLTYTSYSQEQVDAVSERLEDVDTIYLSEAVANGWTIQSAARAIDHILKLSVHKFTMVSYDIWREQMQNSIFRVLHNPTNQLMKLYNEILEPEVAAIVWKERTVQYPLFAGKEISEVVVPVPQTNDQLHIILEQYDATTLSQIMEAIFTDIDQKETEQGDGSVFPEDLRVSIGIAAFEGNIRFNNKQISYFLREQSPREEEYHPLAGLQKVGFPIIESSERSVSETNEAMRQQILIHQSRLIDYKGYRFPLQKSILGQYGYTHVDIFSDENPWYTVVRFHVGEHAQYEVKMNQLLQFMPQGKRMPSADFMQFVEYILLTLLRPVLSEKQDGESVVNVTRRKAKAMKTDASMGKIVSQATQGMGYLRTLRVNPHSPTGEREHASEEAANLFMAVSGRNLRTFNDIRIKADPPLPPKTYVSLPDEVREAYKKDRGNNPRVVNIAPVVIG